MTRIAFLLSLSLASLAALAQTPAEITAERARIAGERQKVEAEFATAQKACYGKFAVNDCINAAQATRRQALADLRRQDVGLNDLERKRRAADRMRSLEERQSEQKEKQRSDATAKAQSGDQARQQRAADKAARPGPQGRARPDAEPKQVEQPDVEGNRRQHAQRVQQAEEHKAKSQARAQKNQKKKAAPLPTPPEAVSLPAAPASK